MSDPDRDGASSLCLAAAGYAPGHEQGYRQMAACWAASTASCTRSASKGPAPRRRPHPSTGCQACRPVPSPTCSPFRASIPGWDSIRSRVRQTVRCMSGAGVERQDQPPSPQLRRQPTGKRGALSRRAAPDAAPPANQGIHPAANCRRQVTLAAGSSNTTRPTR